MRAVPVLVSRGDSTMARRALALALAAVSLTACSGGLRRAGGSFRGPEPAGGTGGPPMAGLHTLAQRGERILEGSLPWPVEVIRANLASTGPIALSGVYLTPEDVLCISNVGTLYCLSRRDLNPRWVSTLRYPLAHPPATTPLDYVFLEQDPRGAAYLQILSRRNGAEAASSPIRLPFSPSSGVSATASTIYVGSLGSPRDNKTVESIDVADGAPGWGFRTAGRVVATPTVDPGGDILLVLDEARGVTALPASPAGSPPASVNWETETLGRNTANPVVTRDLAFIGSEDTFLRCYDLHSGGVLWMEGTDAPIRRAPWLLGTEVAVVREIAPGTEGTPKVTVAAFQGHVFVRNSVGLHAFDAATGTKVFTDPNAERPLVRHGAHVLTVDVAKGVQVRTGPDLRVTGTLPLGLFDFLPTNSRDGSLFAATADGTVVVAVPR
jgi:outer membrane protein assembly factor BamB